MMDLTKIKEAHGNIAAHRKELCDQPECDMPHRCNCQRCESDRALILSTTPDLLAEIERFGEALRQVRFTASHDSGYDARFKIDRIVLAAIGTVPS